MTGFIDVLEKIEPPNQMVAMIKDPLLQKFLILRPSQESLRRVDQWLFAYFEDRLENMDEFEDGILQMLKDILEYTRYTKVLANQNSNMYCLF